MWFGYVPQIKNTNVISARGLHFSRSPIPLPRVSTFPPWPFSLSHSLLFGISSLPTNNLSDVSAFPAFAESSVSTLESHLHMYTHALAYKLLFSETRGEGNGKEEKTGEIGGVEREREKERVGEREGDRCRDETIRAGKSVCSVKLSLRGSSPANLWDTYNASQEYCSVCRPSTSATPLPSLSLFSPTCLSHAPH